MRHFGLLLICTIFFSCNEKIVQLPETHNKTITEVLDVSPAYLFYNEEKDSVEFNRKNIISTTNWLVNVDKRLTLKQAMPHIMYLQNKRQKAGMHKNDAARNYFSCSNPDIQNLAFIDFTEVRYLTEDTLEDDKNPTLCNVIIHNLNNIQIAYLGNKNVVANISTFIDTIKNTSSHKTDTILLRFGFNENLSFQDYISIKSELLDSGYINDNVSKDEIIFK